VYTHVSRAALAYAAFAKIHVHAGTGEGQFQPSCFSGGRGCLGSACCAGGLQPCDVVLRLLSRCASGCGVRSGGGGPGAAAACRVTRFVTLGYPTAVGAVPRDQVTNRSLKSPKVRLV
jgi:hypothetical protein